MARIIGLDPTAVIGSSGAAAASTAISGGVAARSDARSAAHLPFRIADRRSRELAWFREHETMQPLLRGRAYEVAKRLADVAAILLSLPLVLPVLLVCWLAVKFESPTAPGLFVQIRTGRGGQRFRMFKFRTMVPDAEKRKAELARFNKLRWPDFKMENDPRITSLGRLLRKSSLDELPQVFNVLKGEMSLVGPRPTSFGVETYQEWQKARLAVPPGLTGLWQIAGRGKMEFDERVRLDLAYIARRSLLLDARILARTVGAVLRRKGAC